MLFKGRNCIWSNYYPAPGLIKAFGSTFSDTKYSICFSVNGLLSCRLAPIFIIMILWKLVMSIKVVGRVVRLFFHPGKSHFSLSTYWRISLSINRHISRESKRTKPSTSMRSGLFKKMLFTITGSLRKPKFCSIPYWSL